MLNFLRQRWFLIVLLAALASGVAAAPWLKPIADAKPLQNAIVISVMFLMALPLPAAAIWETLRRPWATFIAVAVNMGLLPLIATGLAKTLPGDLGPGLLVAATTPCTLASAAVWTRRAGGNDAVAVLVTVITNGLCFVLTPAWLIWMTGKSVASDEISFGSLAGKLGMVVVFPMAVAQIVRLHKSVGTWSTKHKLSLGLAAQGGILSMVLVGAIQAGLRLRAQSPGWGELIALLWMAAVVLGLHLAMFWVGFQIAKSIRLSREDQIAVGFAGSQKTLMIGVTLATTLQVSIFPMVAYHILQLLADTSIAERLLAPASSDAATKTGNPTG